MFTFVIHLIIYNINIVVRLFYWMRPLGMTDHIQLLITTFVSVLWIPLRRIQYKKLWLLLDKTELFWSNNKYDYNNSLENNKYNNDDINANYSQDN